MYHKLPTHVQNIRTSNSINGIQKPKDMQNRNTFHYRIIMPDFNQNVSNTKTMDDRIEETMFQHMVTNMQNCLCNFRF
jgi:hypothetical protein